MRKFLAIIAGTATILSVMFSLIISTATKDGDYSENYDNFHQQ